MHSLYWIKRPDMYSHMTDGYIGITSHEPKERLKGHQKEPNYKLREAFKGDYEVVTLQSGLTYEEAKHIERLLRPYENIGWNIAPGGDAPPPIKGKKWKLKHKRKQPNRTYENNTFVTNPGDRSGLFKKNNPAFNKTYVCEVCGLGPTNKSAITRHKCENYL